MQQGRALAKISDDELLRRLAELLRQSRRVESDLVAHIAEVDERRLYAREASPSMFAYCTEVLHLSEAEAVVQPLAPARYRVQFTASAQLNDKLERLRALMRSEVPDGDLGAIIERAVTETLERLESRRFARTSRPRKGLAATDTSPSSRHIPAAVRRAVSERDGGRCCYVGETGRRCSERGRLEYHHRRPFGRGGDHSPENIGLACRVHNLYLAEHDYGREAMARYRRSRSPVSSLRASPRGS